VDHLTSFPGEYTMLRKILFLSVVLALVATTMQPVLADVLKGNVQQDQMMQQKQPALNRTKDIEADPFSNKDDTTPGMDAIDAPSDAMKAINQQPLQGNTQTTGNPYNMPLAPQEQAMPQQPVQQPQAQFNPNDPDSGNPAMQLAWDAWHRRVAEAIYTRYNFFAKAAFHNSQPLLCQVSYVVTRDGHITQMNMAQKSNNVLYNVLVFQAVKSLDGDQMLLQFPPGSRRQFVQKYGTFAQNYGANGFKYTTGDQERLGQQQ
jgi:hypothetical protein